jgi:AbiV family abortive infection protein
MKCPKNYDKPVSLVTLAKGHCKSVENARRLIDDSEILIKCGRYLSAINSIMLAIEELAKANLIDQAITFNENDKDKWKWFWNSFHSHKEKLRLLEYQVHWNSYQDKEEFHRRVNLLMTCREESIYVQFDCKNNKFLTPEEIYGIRADVKDFAIINFKYVLGLFKFFIFAGGMPKPEIKLKAYKLYRKSEKIG